MKVTHYGSATIKDSFVITVTNRPAYETGPPEIRIHFTFGGETWNLISLETDRDITVEEQRQVAQLVLSSIDPFGPVVINQEFAELILDKLERWCYEEEWLGKGDQVP